MLRRAFVRRMIFAGLATWFLDLPLPSEPEPETVELYATIVDWQDLDGDGIRETPTVRVGPGTRAEYRNGRLHMSHDIGDDVVFTIGSDYPSAAGAPTSVPVRVTAAPGIRTMDEMRALAGQS